MSNHCKIEFYFKAEQMLELIKKNPDAKGIIIKQEIKPVKDAAGKGFVNLTKISAYAKNGNSRQTDGLAKDTQDVTDPIEGCPYPPGCDGETFS